MLYIFLLIYVSYAFGRKLNAPEKYKYRKYKLSEHLIDILLIPLMDLFQGKDSHWWDYLQVPTPNTSKWLTLEKNKHSIRKFRKYPFVGQYHLSGLIDLYKTLLILKKATVLKPVNYKKNGV